MRDPYDADSRTGKGDTHELPGAQAGATMQWQTRESLKEMIILSIFETASEPSQRPLHHSITLLDCRLSGLEQSFKRLAKRPADSAAMAWLQEVNEYSKALEAT